MQNQADFFTFLDSTPQSKLCCTHAIITRGLYIFTPFFAAVYIVERLVLQTIYLCSMYQTRKFLVLYSRAVSNQERVMIERVQCLKYELSISATRYTFYTSHTGLFVLSCSHQSVIFLYILWNLIGWFNLRHNWHKWSLL